MTEESGLRDRIGYYVGLRQPVPGPDLDAAGWAQVRKAVRTLNEAANDPRNNMGIGQYADATAILMNAMYQSETPVADDCPGEDPPSCHRRHICPDTDQRVAEAAREYVATWTAGTRTNQAHRRLRDAVDAQGGETPEP